MSDDDTAKADPDPKTINQTINHKADAKPAEPLKQGAQTERTTG
jgi:hypothetical protein